MSFSFFSYQVWNLLSVSPHFVDLNLGYTSSKTLKPTLRFARWHELSPLTTLVYHDPRGTTDAVLRVTNRCKCRRNLSFQFSVFTFQFPVLTALAYRDPRGTTDAVLRVTYHCKCYRNLSFQFSAFTFPFSPFSFPFITAMAITVAQQTPDTAPLTIAWRK